MRTIKFIAILAIATGALIGSFFWARPNQKVNNSGGQVTSNNLVGSPAPDFTLKDYSGRAIQLRQLRGKKVVLFFSEGIMCYPACWNQMTALGTDNRLNNKASTTASIVVDQPSEWQPAMQKMPDLGKGTVLFDTDKSVSKRYNMLSVASSMHPGSTPGHTYLIIDQKGIIRYVKDDQSMGIHNDELAAELAKF